VGGAPAGPAQFGAASPGAAPFGTSPAGTGPAPAANIPPPPPLVFNGWTGFYVGAQIGYAWGDNYGSIDYATPGGLFGAPALGMDAQGVIGGAHIGYNDQINQFVIGIEGTVDPTTLYENVLILPPGSLPSGIGNTVSGFVQSTIQGAIRARVGYAFDRVLVYATGGVAFGAFKTYFQSYGIDLDGVTTFYASDTSSPTRVGWTVGGGVEYAINNNYSLFGEYRYSDFGHITEVPAFASGVTYTATRSLSQHQVQVGFSYRFAAPPPLVAKY